jgi:hypothetical protein
MAPNAEGSDSRSGERDWTDEVTDRIESAVAAVRHKTTVPATVAARSAVYGLVAGVLAAAFLVLLVMMIVRLLDLYLPFHPVARRVWVVDAGASAIFLGAGALLWRKRRPRRAR